MVFKQLISFTKISCSFPGKANIIVLKQVLPVRYAVGSKFSLPFDQFSLKSGMSRRESWKRNFTSNVIITAKAMQIPNLRHKIDAKLRDYIRRHFENFCKMHCFALVGEKTFARRRSF